MPNEIRRHLPPQGPPSPGQRAAALVGLAMALPVAIAAEAWRRHREDVALGLIGAGLAVALAVATATWRAGAWVAGSEAA